MLRLIIIFIFGPMVHFAAVTDSVEVGPKLHLSLTPLMLGEQSESSGSVLPKCIDKVVVSR